MLICWLVPEFYIPTRDRSLTATWIALEPVDIDNGCLWVIPGSHRPAIIYPHRTCRDPRFESSGESHGHGFNESDWVPVPLAPGDGLIFNGYLLHRSTENRCVEWPCGFASMVESLLRSHGGSHGMGTRSSTDRFRRSFANHYCSGETLLPWSNDGRFPVSGEGDLRCVLVSGRVE